MPLFRKIGSIFFKYLLSVYSLKNNDPTNGFIAFNANILNRIEFDKTDNRYFFETDLLFRCGLYDVLISEVEIPTIYKNEKSGLNPIGESLRYPLFHIIIFYSWIILLFVCNDPKQEWPILHYYS